MNLYWTSNKSIKGLRHFIVVNEVNFQNKTFFILVSVLDSEISLKVLKDDLIKSDDWHPGWLELSKSESVTKEYLEFKKSKEIFKNQKIVLNENSPFYIS